MGYLNDLAIQIYDSASEKGWHDKPVAFGDCITNIHAELSEAWEEYRHGKALNKTYYTCKLDGTNEDSECTDDVHECYFRTGDEDICEKAKPEGIPSELADVIIRVLDACHMYEIDIDKIIAEKMDYNKTRSYKHGGKII